MATSEVSLVAAFAGGVASFWSPCVLPLVPAYLAVVSGLDVTHRDRILVAAAAAPAGDTAGVVSDPFPEIGPRIATEPGAGDTARPPGSGLGPVTRDTVLFIAGFSTVFVLLGLSATAIGQAVFRQQGLLTRVSGVVVVAMAIFLFATLVLRAPNFYREWRPHPRISRLGPMAAPVAGAAFAFGWTPCVGPILASVLAISAQQGHAATGALLLAVYSLGLGTPFLLTALFFDRVRGPLTWLRRHATAATAVSAAVLAVLGVLLVLDRLASVTTLLQRLI